MAHHIDCEIDTRPLADSLDNVSEKVEHTTAAVIAMQTAVIAADQKASDRVCDNVNRGFYTLMKSQLSQKIAHLQSAVDSHLLRLNQQTKMLLAIKERMDKDYHRTSSRYIKLFDVLNKELRQRVQELDQPIFKFATTEVQVTNNRMTQLVGTFPTMQGEAVTEAQRILASNIKYRSSQVLESSHLFVDQMTRQKLLTDKIMLKTIQANNAQMYAPVVIAEGQYDNNSSISVYAPKTLLGAQGSSTVTSEIFQQATALPWHNTQADKLVANEFSKLLASSPVSERVRKTMQGLASSLNYQTL